MQSAWNFDFKIQLFQNIHVVLLIDLVISYEQPILSMAMTLFDLVVYKMFLIHSQGTINFADKKSRF